MEQIEKTLKVQRVIFWYMLLMNVLYFLITDFFLLDDGAIFTDNLQLEFIVQGVMILVTLGVIYGALRLFKFEWVKRRMEEDTIARYQDMSIVRMALCCGTAMMNVSFYWIFLNTSFMWLAVILLLTTPFIYPGKDRFYNESGYIEK